MSINITTEPINDYASLYSETEQDVLHSLAMATEASVPGAQMLTGHLAGLYLQMISKMLQPQVIVELGTYTGYSAICLAQGLQETGTLYTIDVDERWEAMRNEYWDKAKVAHKIIQKIGNGVDVFKSLEVQPDLVFIDADKKSYWDYFNIALGKMKKGGVILVDNVLFHGEVILPEDMQSKTAQHIHQFNIKAAADTRVEKIMVPLRDGISMFIKK